MGDGPRPHKVQVDEFLACLRTHARGRVNAKKARWLAGELGLGLKNGDRVCRALAHKAVELGTLVCADDSGYFIPLNFDEVRETTGRLRSQGVVMIERATATETLAAATFNHAIPKPPRLRPTAEGQLKLGL